MAAATAEGGATSALLSQPGRITSASLWTATAGAVPPALASRIRFALRLQFHSRHTSAMLCPRKKTKPAVHLLLVGWSHGKRLRGRNQRSAMRSDQPQPRD